MSVFPSNYSDAPLQGLPIGGLEYFAPGPEGDLYILAMPISKQISNVLGSRAHNATVAIKDEDAERRLGRFGATDRNRAVLFGSLERLHDAHDVKDAERAFAKYHKDAVEYFPGKGHTMRFGRGSAWTAFTGLADSESGSTAPCSPGANVTEPLWTLQHALHRMDCC
jgi:hypothetical protein